MPLCLTHRIKQDEVEKTDRINPDGGWRSIKVEEFINSCEYDMKQKDVEVLDFRVRCFLRKNEDLKQMVWERLFEKVFNPDDDPILNWIIRNMDKKTLEHILRRTGGSDMDNMGDECEFDSSHYDPFEEGEIYDEEEHDWDDGDELPEWGDE